MYMNFIDLLFISASIFKLKINVPIFYYLAIIFARENFVFGLRRNMAKFIAIEGFDMGEFIDSGAMFLISPEMSKYSPIYMMIIYGRQDQDRRIHML